MPDTYLLVSEEQRGPFSENEIREMYAAGKITTDTLFWTEDMAEWKPLAQIPGGLEARAVNTIAPPRRAKNMGGAPKYVPVNSKETAARNLSARSKPITVPKALALLVLFFVVLSCMAWVISRTVPDAGQMFADRLEEMITIGR